MRQEEIVLPARDCYDVPNNSSNNVQTGQRVGQVDSKLLQQTALIQYTNTHQNAQKEQNTSRVQFRK